MLSTESLKILSPSVFGAGNDMSRSEEMLSAGDGGLDSKSHLAEPSHGLGNTLMLLSRSDENKLPMVFKRLYTEKNLNIVIGYGFNKYYVKNDNKINDNGLNSYIMINYLVVNADGLNSYIVINLNYVQHNSYNT